MNLNQTTTIPSGKDVQRKWFVLDASGQTLGRLASRAANVLTGKNNPLYTPYIDMGDHVIVINAEKIVEEAIKGMLPKSKLGRQMATKLKVYKGTDHPHKAQQPTALSA